MRKRICNETDPQYISVYRKGELTMKLKPFVLLSLLTIFIWMNLTGCSLFSEEKNMTATLTETETSINVKLDETFHVVLTSNATTGYEWVWNNEAETTGITLLSSEYKTSPDSKGVTGAGGEEMWQFKASAEGSHTLNFVYVFPEEPERPSAKQVTFTVHVSR